MDPFTIIGAGMQIGSSIFGAVSAKKEEERARKQADEAREKMNSLKAQYEGLDTSNPYLNMENTMEDLTINQKQADFQRQSFQQSQANIMQGLRGAAGGSGIAALAQSLSQQGQIAAQQSSASIGQQESANQRAMAQQASAIQSQERQGEVYSRDLEREKTSTLLGMAQQETAAYQAQEGAARQAKTDAITSGITGMTDMFAGFGDAKSTSDTNPTALYNATGQRINADGQKIDADGNIIT